MNTSLRRLCHTNNLEGWIYVISTSNIFNIYLIVWVFKLVKLNVAFNATFGLKKMNKTVRNTVPSSSLSCVTFASFFHLFYFLNFFIVCFAFFSSFNAFFKKWMMHGLPGAPSIYVHFNGPNKICYLFLHLLIF